LFRSLFLIPKVPERLLHGLTKLIPKTSWLEAEEFLVESTK
jgi:hypothetical protein